MSSDPARPPAPSAENGFLADHVTLMCESYRRLTGRSLVDARLSPLARAKAVFRAPFAVVSHDTAADPVFNYANQTALRLFEMSWEAFTRLPSRCSAEPVDRDERARLLAEVTKNGYIGDYAGIRISKSKRRFMIERATVWNLTDASGAYRGQAAAFGEWRFV